MLASCYSNPVQLLTAAGLFFFELVVRPNLIDYSSRWRLWARVTLKEQLKDIQISKISDGKLRRVTATYGHWEVLKIEQVTGLTLDHAIRITFDASEAANVRASKVYTQLIQKNSDCLWGNLAKRIPAHIAQCKGRSWTLVSLVAFKGNARRVHWGFFFLHF